MNKKQLGQLIREQRPEPPNGYEVRMEYRLARLTREEESMRKRYKFSTVLVAACLLVAILAGTAFAASILGIFDYFKGSANPIIPLDGAEGIVATNLGISENEFATLTVEEAVFDGQGVLVKCRLTPKDTEKYAMLNAFMQETPEDIYITESAPAEFGEGSSEIHSEDGVISISNTSGSPQLLINGKEVEIPTDREVALEKGLPVYLNNGALCYTELNDFRVLGRRDGRETIGYWIDVTVGDDLIFPNISDAQEQEDGSIVWWQSGVADEVLNVDSIEIQVSAQLYEGDETGDAKPAVNEISFTLPKSEDERLYSIVPVGDGKGERFEILSGSIAFTKVRGYFNVNYTYEQAETGEEMGIDFRLYDAEGNEIATGSGKSSVEPDENGVCWRSTEMQSFDEVPESIWLEAKVIGWDKTLGRVECQLVESTDTNTSVEESSVEKTLVPSNSGSGNSINLIDVRIQEGHNVHTVYQYSGDRIDGARIELIYKNSNGDIIGNVATSNGIVKANSQYERDDMINIDQWPDTLMLEFMLDGVVLDVFECSIANK